MEGFQDGRDLEEGERKGELGVYIKLGRADVQEKNRDGKD